MQKAFSLVELSIVLVILGLLTGGILAGRALIHAAEMRSLVAEYQRYRASTYAFRDRYMSLPGELTNATAFWGVRSGSGSSTGSDVACFTTRNVTDGTCNGNGDGNLDVTTGTDSTTVTIARFLFWQHLAFSGFIEGSYSGSLYSTEDVIAPPGFIPPNLPAARLSGVVWSTSGKATSAGSFFAIPRGNLLRVVKYGTGGYQVISPEDAWAIDTKLDDAKPATGNIVVYKKSSSASPNCATTDAIETAEYNLPLTDKVCSPHMPID